MANLKTEYTDTGGRKHKVEHIFVPDGDKEDGERAVEELLQVLTEAGKKSSGS